MAAGMNQRGGADNLPFWLSEVHLYLFLFFLFKNTEYLCWNKKVKNVFVFDRKNVFDLKSV